MSAPVEIEILSGARVELGAEILARAFWAMDTVQQADFFEELAKRIKSASPKAYSYGEMQWCYLQDELRKPGRELANEMHMALSVFAFDFWPQKQNGARTGLQTIC